MFHRVKHGERKFSCNDVILKFWSVMKVSYQNLAMCKHELTSSWPATPSPLRVHICWRSMQFSKENHWTMVGTSTTHEFEPYSLQTNSLHDKEDVDEVTQNSPLTQVWNLMPLKTPNTMPPSLCYLLQYTLYLNYLSGRSRDAPLHVESTWK